MSHDTPDKRIPQNQPLLQKGRAWLNAKFSRKHTAETLPASVDATPSPSAKTLEVKTKSLPRPTPGKRRPTSQLLKTETLSPPPGENNSPGAKLPAPLISRSEAQQLERVCKEILALQPDLSLLKQAIGRFGADIESEFIMLSKTLRQISQQLPTLTRSAETLDKIILNKDDDRAFSYAYQLFKKSTDLVTAGLEFSDSISHELDYFASQVQSIRIQRDKIESAFFVFNILKLNFRMKAVRLDDDKEANFLDVANKIENIYQKLESLIETEFNKIIDIYHFIRNAQKDFSTNRIKQSGAIENSKLIIQKNLNQIQESLDPAATFARQVEKITAVAQSRVSQVIIGLQYQDIVQSKLEVVALALNEMNEHSNANLLTNVDPAQKKKACAFLHHSALQQLEQIRTAKKEITRAGDQILQGIRDLLNVGIHLIGETKQLALESMGDARLIDSFVEELKNLNSVLDASAKINYSIPPLVERIGETMETFSQDIMRLSRVVRLVALNSQAMSVSLPTGHAMGELSSQTRATADSTLQISQQLSKQLRDILPEINQVKERFEKFMEVAEQDQDRLNQECQIASDKLIEMRRLLAEQFENVESKFTGVQRDAEALLAKITFPQLIESRLGEAEQMCEKLLRLTSPFASEEDLRALQELNRKQAEERREILRSNRRVSGRTRSPFMRKTVEDKPQPTPAQAGKATQQLTAKAHQPQSAPSILSKPAPIEKQPDQPQTQKAETTAAPQEKAKTEQPKKQEPQNGNDKQAQQAMPSTLAAMLKKLESGKASKLTGKGAPPQENQPPASTNKKTSQNKETPSEDNDDGIEIF